MNAITLIMLIFAAIGLIDKAFALKWGLSDSFDKGLNTLGSMFIPVTSICCVGVEFIQRHSQMIVSFADSSPIDPTLIIGALFAPDLGAYFLCREMTDSMELLVINGIILGTLMGQAICFQLPVFLSGIDNEHHTTALKGFLFGMVMIPPGMIAAELIYRADLMLFIRQFVPVLILCALLALGLVKIPKQMIRGFYAFGRAFQILTYFMFAIVIMGLFIPKFAYSSIDSLYEGLTILTKCTIIICGSLVMSTLILKFFRSGIQRIAAKLGVNEVSLVCLLMSCATSLAILPLFNKMDEKGRLMNSAFAISGAYIIGGSMGFVSAVSNSLVVVVFIVAKAVSGILSIFLVHKMYKG